MGHVISEGMVHVISELCSNRTILIRNYRKKTILWSFSYNSLQNSMVKIFGHRSMTVLYPNL